MKITLEERVFLVLAYDKCFCARHVRTQFRFKFNHDDSRKLPSNQFIRRLHKKFKKEGTLLPTKREMKGGYDTKDKERRVDEHFKANPRSSIRKSCHTLGMPKETVRRFLNKTEAEAIQIPAAQ